MKRPGRRRAESGAALLLAVFVLFLLSAALALVAASLELRLRQVRTEASSLALRTLADAALAEALAHLAASASFRGEPEHPWGEGVLASEVRFLGPHRYEVIARASFRGVRRTVRAEVVRSPGSARVVRWRPLPRAQLTSPRTPPGR